jgi:hypothetical protein
VSLTFISLATVRDWLDGDIMGVFTHFDHFDHFDHLTPDVNSKLNPSLADLANPSG